LSLTVDTSKIAQVGKGYCYKFDDSVAASDDEFHGIIRTDSVGGLVCQSKTSNQDTDNDTWGATIPFTFAQNDRWRFQFAVPVNEWSGTSIVFQPTKDDLALTEWRAFDVNTTWNGVVWTTSDGFFMRDGPNLKFRVRANNWVSASSFYGLSESDLLTDIEAITGKTLTVDEARMPQQNLVSTCGRWSAHDESASVGRWGGVAYWVHSSNVIQFITSHDEQQVDTNDPITWAANDDFDFECELPILEWRDVGSIPPIGVEVAGDGRAGLLEQFDQIIGEVGTGETCVSNCDACTVTNLTATRINNHVTFGFNIAVDPTASGTRLQCRFDPPLGAPLDFTTGASVHGTCGQIDAGSGSSAGTLSGDITNEAIFVVISEPGYTSARNHRCVGFYHIP